jgi:asparagine N-glycosylation enzyme membrane subunit Stt3
MTVAVKRPQASPAHPEEWFSILLALGATAACILFFLYEPRFEPESRFAWAIPGWLAGAYLFTQILFLLVSATQIRVLGVLDSIISIVPVVAGFVMVIEWLIGHVPLSGFQLNALAMLIATSVAEFLLTIWIRFVINRRTIAIDSSV